MAVINRTRKDLVKISVRNHSVLLHFVRQSRCRIRHSAATQSGRPWKPV